MRFVEEKINVICNKLKEMTEEKICDVSNFKYAECGYKETNFPPDNLEWKAFEQNERIGGKNAHFWFCTEFLSPKFQDGKQLVFELKTGREGQWDAVNPQCLVYLNGEMVQGLDTNHTQVPLEYETNYEMMIYVYTGMGNTLIDFLPSLKFIDKKIEKLYYDLSVPFNAALCLEPESSDYRIILKYLEAALGYLDLRVPFSKAFYTSADTIIEYLNKEFYNGICGKSDAIVNCIGHTHIDVAWLWTLEQTREKAQRSFSTAIQMMKLYPEYKFMSSQPQLYQYVKEDAPQLYAEIKKMIKQGRWEVEGGMWLEADCNLSSGESLIRQIIFGKRFIKQEFNVDSKILWLPDVFGYSAALPQILLKCGIKSFVTAKISWSEFNQMPYDNFLWEGIDGSEIFSQFITVRNAAGKFGPTDYYTTYVGMINPNQILGTWKRYQQKEYNNEVLMTFGYGDGGGGPTGDMLEQQKRLAYGIPGIPKTKIDFAGVFLKEVKNKFDLAEKEYKHIPKWVGELYLELHRGTYTSMAKNKKNNRKSELLYQKAETLCAIDMVHFNSKYPQMQINKAWRTILLNQFHDIIPGSSIFEVYEECDRQYENILRDGNILLQNKFDHIASNVCSDKGIFVYNPNSFICSGLIDYGGKKVFVGNVPSFGYKVFQPELKESKIKVSEKMMENSYYRILFDDKGNIVSLYDKVYSREIVKKDKKLNEMQVFEDFPRDYDAWEISIYYKQKMWIIDSVVDINIVNEGARAGLKITKAFLDSLVTQTIYIYENIRNIDFETTIEWKQEHMLLKAAFPMDIHANEAAYDIQFGNIKRPTHSNTSWDEAKFEVCAHKWADISEDGYGVSLLNDCKYGHSAEGSVLKLTLIKSATYPNPKADKEKHEFVYSLYPHYGGFKEGNTVQAAYMLNQPLIAREIQAQNGCLPSEYSFINCDNNNIIIETVKKAEDNNDIIIRLYEAHDRRTYANLKFGFDFNKVFLCDMLENNITELEHSGCSLKLLIKNYEIITLKIVL